MSETTVKLLLSSPAREELGIGIEVELLHVSDRNGCTCTVKAI
jgi:hypothetical protein